MTAMALTVHHIHLKTIVGRKSRSAPVVQNQNLCLLVIKLVLSLKICTSRNLLTYCYLINLLTSRIWSINHRVPFPFHWPDCLLFSSWFHPLSSWHKQYIHQHRISFCTLSSSCNVFSQKLAALSSPEINYAGDICRNKYWFHPGKSIKKEKRAKW